MANPPDSSANQPPIAQFVVGIMEIFYGEQPGDTPPGSVDASLLKTRVDDLIASVVGDPPTPVGATAEELGAQAAARAWDAAENGDDSAPDLALLALRYWPSCADAYVLLGLSAGDQADLALPLFTLGVVAGAEAIGPAAFSEEGVDADFWQNPDARPFMAALGLLARTNREIGALDAAAVHFAEMLRLNPNDDQGARYELMAIALAMGDMETAANLFRAYGDDAGPVFAYARALFAFRHGGDTDRSRLTVRDAREVNTHVPPFMLGARPIPEELDEEFESGGESEAALCAELLRPAWQSTPGAMEWLRAQTAGLVNVAPPPKEKRSGPRQL
ncbi:MAG: tetratricopeptide repeat protein [Dehalococcoidia bacterium]